jgi:hypothetical protein
MHFRFPAGPWHVKPVAQGAPSPGQHSSPAAPHCAQWASTHMLFAMSQHASAPVHVLPAQQASATAPHGVHVPATHACPATHTSPVQQV